MFSMNEIMERNCNLRISVHFELFGDHRCTTKLLSRNHPDRIKYAKAIKAVRSTQH